MGYDNEQTSSRVVAIYKEGVACESLRSGEQGVVILDETPFYGESGGQIGDTGQFQGHGLDASVTTTTKQGDLMLHHVSVAHGELAVGASIVAGIDGLRRAAIRRNHSATHLLHAALRKVLGPHVQQKGSLVTAERLRFDFSHDQPVSAEQRTAIVRMVNEQIIANTAVSTQLMSMDEAVNAGAMALFGEKYGDEVRVLTMGDDAFSV